MRIEDRNSDAPGNSIGVMYCVGKAPASRRVGISHARARREFLKTVARTKAAWRFRFPPQSMTPAHFPGAWRVSPPADRRCQKSPYCGRSACPEEAGGRRKEFLGLTKVDEGGFCWGFRGFWRTKLWAFPLGAALTSLNHRWTQINTDNKNSETTNEMPRQMVSPTPGRVQLGNASENLCPSVFICG